MGHDKLDGSRRTITGMITGKEDPRSEVFTENRMKIAFADDYAAEGAKAVKSYLREIFNITDIYTADLKRGQGGVFIYDGVKAACTRTRRGCSMPLTPNAPIWAASWSGTQTKKAGTAPAMAPALPTGES